MTLGLKEIFQRPRPAFQHPFVSIAGYSFPSAHASVGLLLYGFLAIIACQIWGAWRARVSILLAAVFLIALIGFSRIVLGVHYLSDVMGGYAAALGWLSLSLTSVEMLRRGRGQLHS